MTPIQFKTHGAAVKAARAANGGIGYYDQLIPQSCSSATRLASRVSARWQLFIQKCPRVSGWKIIDLAKTQKTAMLIELCRSRIECIEIEADALPRAGFHLGMRQQLASGAPSPPALCDPKMPDIEPAPMGDPGKSASERVAVISMN